MTDLADIHIVSGSHSGSVTMRDPAERYFKKLPYRDEIDWNAPLDLQPDSYLELYEVSKDSQGRYVANIIDTIQQI